MFVSSRLNLEKNTELREKETGKYSRRLGEVLVRGCVMCLTRWAVRKEQAGGEVMCPHRVEG